MLLHAKELNKTYGTKPVLADVTFSVEPGDKIGLIGVNGTGKSSLLKVLEGSEDFQGSIQKSRELKMAALLQNPVFHEKTVWQECLHRNAARKEPRPDYEMRSMLTRLGVADENAVIEEMSGGQRKRLALALTLMEDFSLLLLDEPTNHLDNDMIVWLEDYLRKTKAALIMVTHDRYFLDRICNRIFELDHGTLYEHQGNYEDYLENKQERLASAQADRAKLENLYRKELSWMRAGVQARGTKSRSRIERFEELREKRQRQNEQELQLQPVAVRLGRKTIEWENLGWSWPDQPLFHDFSYNCTRHDRIGICGPNGCGKSTFLRLLAGQLVVQTGTISKGDTVRLGWFQQEDPEMDLSMKALDYIGEKASVVQYGRDTLTASALLERFQFPDSLQYMPIERLSGGERRRLYLCRVLMEMPNVLLLDEPTNDLDLVTLDILEDYLDHFPGILIVVSHDRYFLDRLCDRLFILDEGTWKSFTGGSAEAAFEAVQALHKPVSRGDTRKPRRKNPLSYQEKKELEALPGQLEALQNEIEALNEKIGTLNVYEEMAAASAKRDALQNELDEKEMRWLELEEKRESDGR